MTINTECVIARHEEGITLNGYEFILENDQETIKQFENKEKAVYFLKQLEVSDEEIYFLKFFNYEKLIQGKYEEI